ncbi:MAG: deoxyribodipyrimidine photo-lyase [Flavobacteriales bacterium]|nr:deoxyribodipyrimidine photo-lyase [Flavobacteriales bacterium]
MNQKLAIWWMRRDLRLTDVCALQSAMEQGSVLPLFIFDTQILDKLENKRDRRVQFIHSTLTGLKERLEKDGTTLLVKHGDPGTVWRELVRELPISSVHYARDHEPYGLRRDETVRTFLKENGIAVSEVKDISVFERDEVVKDDGKPYTVYTPYMRRWRALFEPAQLAACRKPQRPEWWLTDPVPMPSMEQLGFEVTDHLGLEPSIDQGLLSNYHRTRELPGINGTSRLGVHLRFGTISVREVMCTAMELNEKFVNELIWREFYMSILYHFPHVVTRSFRPEYDSIPWRNDEAEFQAWCGGRTGYPLVDAGMRELEATGYMHNRVRMVVASFLTKHLLIDWRWGEAWFAARLLDYELSSNNGGWQWAAGSGCDAAPYFRVFNPTLQLDRFDPDLRYVRKWVPEYGTSEYPPPVVDHPQARKRAISTYQSALKGNVQRTDARAGTLF